MRFNNGDELARYYSNLISSGKIAEAKSDLVSQGVSADLIGTAFVSEGELKEAAEFLRECLLKHLQRYFASYSPVMYERTGQLLDSIEVDITRDGDKLQAVVSFDTSKTMRESLFGGDQGDVVLLLDQGWQVTKDVWFKDIEHFGYFDGIGFISSAIADAEGDPRFRHIQITPSEELVI